MQYAIGMVIYNTCVDVCGVCFSLCSHPILPVDVDVDIDTPICPTLSSLGLLPLHISCSKAEKKKREKPKKLPSKGGFGLFILYT